MQASTQFMAMHLSEEAWRDGTSPACPNYGCRICHWKACILALAQKRSEMATVRFVASYTSSYCLQHNPCRLARRIERDYSRTRACM